MDAGTPYYENLAQIVVDGVREPFEKAMIHAEIDEEAAEFSTVFLTKDGRRHSVFIEDQLEPVLREWRTKMSESNSPKWYVFDFELLPDGKFKVNYGYQKTKWMLY